MPGDEYPEIRAAYDAVRDDKDDTNWLLISYAKPNDPKSKELAPRPETGTGGLEKMAGKLDDSQVQYGYARVEYSNDAESKRIKFALIVWIGCNAKPLRKASAGTDRGAVKMILVHHSIEVDADERGDIKHDDIVKRLRKAGGADYNGGRG